MQYMAPPANFLGIGRTRRCAGARGRLRGIAQVCVGEGNATRPRTGAPETNYSAGVRMICLPCAMGGRAAFGRHCIITPSQTMPLKT